VKHPTKIGKYEVIDVIGRGGMGIVYKATDPQLDRLVAIKMMTVGYAEDPDVLKRFYREAQSTGNLHHANIVTVYDLGDQDGNPYLVMEYLEGESLDAVISSRRALTVLDKVQLILETCRGLNYAHERGVIHRDIKPGNIMVSKNGSVKLVDFGIAHIASKTLTRTGQIMGSINYMSPEQINGRPPVDQRTDIFSTGVVLYQLFTYVLPFEGESTAATMFKIMHDPPPPLDRYLKVYPKELESIVLRALAKNREDRYPSADEFALDLLQVHEQLKDEVVARHLQEAEAFVRKGELNRARDQLLQLLKLDQKHTQAIRLLRQVQQKFEKEQGVEQARQLRAKAEESYEHADFEAALLYLDRAIAVDTSNPELPKFRELIRETKLKSEELQRALRRAEILHERGDLDAAKQAADEALEINSNDTQAKALYRIIHRDWVERSRQLQLEGLLQSARREISQHNLTAALNILGQAETLDPQGGRVRALVEEVNAIRDQERRRKELERIHREVEDALNRDDYETASVRVEQGLKEFPQDRGLLQFKALAARQRAAAERRLFVQQKVSTVRQLLDTGKAAEALAVLRNALREVPQEPQLETLLAVAQEQVAQDEQTRRRAGLEAINHSIEEALSHEDYEGAGALVEEGLKQFPQNRVLTQLKSLVDKQRTAADRKSLVRQQIAGVQKLLDADQAREALTLLQSAIEKFPQEPQLETLLSMIRDRIAREEGERAKARSIQQARDAISRHAFREAVQILEAAQVRFLHSPEIDDILQFAREQEAKESSRKATEVAIRRAQQWMSEYQYERAIQLLETTFRQAPDDQIRVILEEARRRAGDYQAGLRAVITKAEQFLREGAAAKAIEFLEAQPLSYRSSDRISELLKMAKKLPKAKPVAPVDQKTVIMRGTASPSPVTTLPSTTQWPAPQPQTEEIPEPPPPAKWKRTVIAAVALVVLVVGALALWNYWPTHPPMGTLIVQTNVAGAEVYVDGVSKGATKDDMQVKIQINPGNYEIRVQKEGWPAASQQIEIAKNKETAVRFELPPPPPPPPPDMGELEVRTNVDGVDVFVDDAPKENTGKNKKLDISKLSVGSHVIRVEKLKYDPVPASKIEIQKDKHAVVSFTLKPSTGELGYLQITGKPRAEVSIDGKFFGNLSAQGTTKSPIQVKPSPPLHHVELSLDGFERWSQDVSVKEGESLPVHAEMIPNPVAPSGTFTATPATIQEGQSATLSWNIANTTDVSIDGGLGSNLEWSGSKSVTPTKTTTYKLTAHGPGGETAYSTTVTVEAPPKPPVVEFKLSAQTIQQGQSVTLSWRTSNATDISIEGVGSGLGPSGSLQVLPTETTTYKLIAKGPGGTATSDQLQITVQPNPKPTEINPEEADINRALDCLIDGYESLSVDEVKKCYPTVPAGNLEKAFKNAKALRMRLSDRKVSVSGDSATVECTELMTYTIGSKLTPAPPAQLVIQLKKSATGWVIVKM
jgi:serine/threonine protein kinase